MFIEPKTLIGRFEILSLLGAGGMGEVYRATDTKIGRDVAIKVLTGDFSTDKLRLRRFEQEARAAGALNHPNILSIFDVGTTDDGLSYVVSELLEGQTLRDHLAEGALTPRKAVEYALQIISGLAAAHEKGIVHRDLKPENIFITTDERIKILDFGLAKLNSPLGTNDADTEAATVQIQTTPGIVLGTVGYMSPEQVRAHQVDHRSDIFSFGAMLYEMLTGRRAFQGESAAETMTLILREDPPELHDAGRELNPALRQIVFHCLEKNPEQRFQSARDLAFDLQMIAGLTEATTLSSAGIVARSSVAVTTGEVAPAVATNETGTPARRTRRRWLLLALAALLLVGVPLAFFLGKRAGKQPLPTYRQLTYRRGTIWSARFAPDGETVVYSATWNGNPLEIFSTRPESPESRSLELTGTDVLAVSSTGELAVLLNRQYLGWFISRGTLARMPLVGGAPREIIEDVQQADWSPDGSSLAVVRYVGGRNRLEYPIGKVLYETAGYISHPHISPDGERVAFYDHQVQWDNRGWVSVVDREGSKKSLSGEWGTAEGLAWSPEGDEIWFTATKGGEALALYAVTLEGQERAVARAPVSLMLHDISRKGNVLLTADNQLTSIMALPPGDKRERDLSWLDWVGVNDLAADGRTFIFTQFGEGSGTNYAVYLRKTDGSPAVRLGDGQAWGLSPDGKWVLAILNTPSQIVLHQTRAGETRQLPRGPIERYGFGANWMPDGKSVIFIGREQGHGMRCYVQEIEGGALPRAVTPEGVTGRLVSPDGRFLIVNDPSGRKSLYALDGTGQTQAINGLEEGEDVIGWNTDSRALYVFRRGEMPVRVSRLDLASGDKEFWREVSPADTAGILAPPRIYLTPDGKSYVYQLARYISDLYFVEGLR
ncbi:MAG TPA: protein kinase [Pyrinomonadaceae bacterium]|jgi:Tol biopolymer transport system component|nr:protein kinase [Pyrinomonadaceae bacterium]